MLRFKYPRCEGKWSLFPFICFLQWHTDILVLGRKNNKMAIIWQLCSFITVLPLKKVYSVFSVRYVSGWFSLQKFSACLCVWKYYFHITLYDQVASFRRSQCARVSWLCVAWLFNNKFSWMIKATGHSHKKPKFCLAVLCSTVAYSGTCLYEIWILPHRPLTTEYFSTKIPLCLCSATHSTTSSAISALLNSSIPVTFSDQNDFVVMTLWYLCSYCFNKAPSKQLWGILLH